MDGWDMIEVEVYRKRRSIEKWIETQVSKRDKHKKGRRRRERKESEQCNYLYKLSLLRRACGGRYTPLFYKINLFFSILILGQSPFLLFISLSYKFYWFGPRFNCATHCSKWAWATRFFGPYISNLNYKI